MDYNYVMDHIDHYWCEAEGGWVDKSEFKYIAPTDVYKGTVRIYEYVTREYMMTHLEKYNNKVLAASTTCEKCRKGNKTKIIKKFQRASMFLIVLTIASGLNILSSI